MNIYTMTDTTTSAVLAAPRTIELREFEIPEIDDDSAVLSVDLTGVCATDIKVYKGLFREEVLPAILGHEVVGTIERIGRDLSDQFGVSEGDRVVVDPLRRCGKCSECIDGEYPFCEQVGGPKNSGVHGYISTEVPPSLWGGYGEHMYVDNRSILYPIDENTPSAAAMLSVAIVGNSVSWLQAADVNTLERSLVIQGPGPQGLSMTTVADQMGFSPIVVVGVPGDEARLREAEKRGADVTICREPNDLVSETLERTGTADVVVNLTGIADSVQQSVELVSRNGTIVHASLVGEQPSEVYFDKMVRMNVNMQGVLSRTASHTRQAVRLLEDRPDLFDRMVTDKYPVREADNAIRDAAGEFDGPTPLKVAINPSL